MPVTTTGSGIDMIQTPLLGFTDVTEKFHSWFLYGFILNCVALVYSALSFLYHATESVVVSYLANFMGCAQGCAVLVFIGFGLTFRFGFEGRVCSGEFAEEADQAASREPYAWASG